MFSLIIIGGPASNNIEKEITQLTGIKSIKIDYKIFPDGESYIRFPLKIKDDTVILVQSLFPPQDKHLTELFLMIDTAYDLGAKEVAVVVPYMAYSRQDKRFLEGEAISIKTILKIIEKLGAKYFVTVDIHKEESLD
ncbi:MAG TPA: ribose-phosphate pyrophosphokinase, partial [Thermoprotei archaeon]|nr:ribose-phosphate pyrophosphokinase [Thermoprotei archaeon]